MAEVADLRRIQHGVQVAPLPSPVNASRWRASMPCSERLVRQGALHLKTMSPGGFTALLVGSCCLINALPAWAADVAANALPLKQFPAAQTFTILFLMLGPFKVVGPFLKVTQGADEPLVRQIALRATLFAAVALLVAAFLGESFLSSYGIPLPVLALSAGIILFLVALRSVLDQFELPEPAHHDGKIPAGPPSPNVALAPLAFPTIVTPYGIAALVVFLAVSQSVEGRLIVGRHRGGDHGAEPAPHARRPSPAVECWGSCCRSWARCSAWFRSRWVCRSSTTRCAIWVCCEMHVDPAANVLQASIAEEHGHERSG